MRRSGGIGESGGNPTPVAAIPVRKPPRRDHLQFEIVADHPRFACLDAERSETMNINRHFPDSRPVSVIFLLGGAGATKLGHYRLYLLPKGEPALMQADAVVTTS